MSDHDASPLNRSGGTQREAHDLLGESLSLGPLRVDNRIVMPPLVVWLSDAGGEATHHHVDHYARSGGPGLQIVEATAISPEGRLHGTQLGIWSDSQVPGLRRIAEAIHNAGGVAGIQLHHAGGSTQLKHTYGEPPRVPSLTAPGVPDGSVELTDAQIAEAIEAFAHATRRALDAGFEVIELHGAHGYLISQFLSPVSNVRTDEWGGSPEARRRFLRRAVGAAREEIDRHRDPAALCVRLGVAASGTRELSIEEGLAAAADAVEAGADFLDVSHGGGMDPTLAEEVTLRSKEILTNADPTLLLSALVRASQRVPVVGVSGIRTPEAAAEAIEAGVCDLVAVGRAILADPGWARKSLRLNGDGQVGDDNAPAAIELCHECRPRCFWFKEPERCPARRRLAKRGEQTPLEDIYDAARR